MNKVAAAKEMLKLAKSLTAAGRMGWYEAGKHSMVWAASLSALEKVTKDKVGEILDESEAVLGGIIARASRIAGEEIKYNWQESYLRAIKGERIQAVTIAEISYLTAEQFAGMVQIFGKQGMWP